MLIAITRDVSPGIHACELTHVTRKPIDLDRARVQHRRYEHCLAELGCNVVSLPAESDLPDSVFVEDTALVLDELAIVLRPGAESRRGETASIARALAPYRLLSHVEAPGIVDGGDILRLGRAIFVGQTPRSNAAGIEQLHSMLRPFGCRVEGVPVRGCLHLKSAVTQIADEALLINRAFVDPASLPTMRLINVDASEPNAANALRIGEVVLFPEAFPETARRLEAAGIRLRRLDISELAKAEAGLTCCSLVFDAEYEGP
jgi:dimethylargininase